MSWVMIGVLALGFVFGWLGRTVDTERMRYRSFALGFEAGFNEAAGIVNSRCRECRAAGEPEPLNLRIEGKRISY